jgi:hypothetical protein
VKRIGPLISPIIKGCGLEEAVRFEEIKSEWATLFREPLSLHMCPSHLKNGELLITVDSPVWLQQLTFFKEEITKNVSPFGVTRVRFKVGRVTHQHHAQGSRTQRQTGPSLESSDVKEIEDTIATLPDNDLRDSLRKAMGKSFSDRKRHRK